MQRSALCRSRRELFKEYLLAKIGVFFSFLFHERDCSTLLACLLASIQPRTSPSKFGGLFNSVFTSLLNQESLRKHQYLKSRVSSVSFLISRLKPSTPHVFRFHPGRTWRVLSQRAKQVQIGSVHGGSSSQQRSKSYLRTRRCLFIRPRA